MIIYLTGPDGSGKTTYLEEIQRHFNEKGNRANYVWLRSPKILSKPLMAYCRLAGLTRYKTIDGIRYGGHEFYRSKFVSWLFPVLQLIDFKIKLLFKQKEINKDNIVLLDRFALDTLADLMVDTHRFDLHRTAIGRSFISSIPDKCKIIVLEATENIIRKRKKDTLHDPNLSNKIKAYSILASDLNLTKINNNHNQSEVRLEIFEELGLNERH